MNPHFEIPEPMTATPNPHSEIPPPQSPTLNPKSEIRNSKSNPPGPGRPRKLDEFALREICALVSAGCGIGGAARYVGCASSTVHREARRNEQFAKDLRRAHLSAELNPLNAMRAAASKHWRAAAWLLERTNPQRFGKQNLAFMKPEQLDEFGKILAEIIREEVAAPTLRTRLLRRIVALSEQAQREAWDSRHDSCPRPRKNKEHSRMRAASTLPPDTNATDVP